ncbi:MAG TPA: hypothetical protein VF412_10345 [Bdellovibrio sp.]|uniref:hypothetical protein n=1 Tax=Bdellovibrio sp. TaxID=28201 RepID=UPI002F19E944
MKYWILALLVLFSLTGCLKTKSSSQSSIDMTADDKKTLVQDCIDMKAQGNIFELLARIKKDTDRILGILSDEKLNTKEDEIRALADRISENAKKVESLSSEAWTTARFNQDIKWDIDAYDFKDLIGPHMGGFKIRDYEISGVYLMGAKRDDLLGNLTMTSDEEGIHISYKNKASSLEVCELQKTLMIVVEVRYQNVLLKGTRYFDLIVKR